MKRSLAVLVAALGLLVAAAPAQARTFEFGMEDEGLVLGAQHLAPQVMGDWNRVGVDVARVHARWWEIGPAQSATKKPSGFNAANHLDPHYDWSKLDTAVATLRGAGIKVMLSITGPGPLWTSGNPRKHQPRYKPKPSEYAAFARAVATRYKDQVDRYLLWNEPNQKGWLQPQWEKKGRSWVPVSPHIYRDLVRAAQPAVRAADPGAEVVIGELAPVGNRPISSLTPMEPLPFLRSMGCVDDRYKSIRTGACKRFKPAKGNTFGYHPHPLRRAPDAVNKDPDQAQFGDLKRLFTTLDKLRSRKRLSVGKNIHLTEFGYETNPPDPASGISLALQTRYLQQASYIAWATKRVLGLSFYQWFDEPTVNAGSGTKRYSGWQTGLLTNTGQPKPVLSVIASPFVIDQKPGSKSGLLWGQVRAPSQGQVVIERRAKGASEFQEIARVSPAADGVWTRRMTLTANASYRYRWTPQGSFAEPLPADRYSGIVDLSKKEKSRYKAALATS